MYSTQQRHFFCLLLIFFMGFCTKTRQFTIVPKQELNSDKSMVSFVSHTDSNSSNLTTKDGKSHEIQPVNATPHNAIQLTKSEARGSTYSYYYISRRIWYIPLWFLIYFCFYIMGLIIRSLILHKIKANPTELTTGRLLDQSSSVNTDVVNELTTRVLDYIERYQGNRKME